MQTKTSPDLGRIMAALARLDADTRAQFIEGCREHLGDGRVAVAIALYLGNAPGPAAAAQREAVAIMAELAAGGVSC